MFGGRSAAYPQADTPTTRQVFGTDYRRNKMYVTEKEMRDRLKLDSKSDLIGKLVMAYMTIRQLQEKLEGAKNTEQQVQADSQANSLT